MLELSQHEVNLGDLQPNTLKSFEVQVHNNGNEEITPHLTASCGCTVPTLEPKVILPGNDATIKAVFDTTGKKGFQRKSIHLTFPNDEGMSTTLSVSFKANIHE